MEKSFFEQMGAAYYQQGDYFLPNLSVPEYVPVGVWEQRRRQYLRLGRNYEEILEQWRLLTKENRLLSWCWICPCWTPPGP